MKKISQKSKKSSKKSISQRLCRLFLINKNITRRIILINETYYEKEKKCGKDSITQRLCVNINYNDSWYFNILEMCQRVLLIYEKISWIKSVATRQSHRAYDNIKKNGRFGSKGWVCIGEKKFIEKYDLSSLKPPKLRMKK